MTLEDALYKVFEPLSQGAPGNEASTLRALHSVPQYEAARAVLDLGVGQGRTTMTLAQALPNSRITAVEIHAPFVKGLAQRIRKAGFATRVEIRCADMEVIEVSSESMDLIWAEGSIYLMGIDRALGMWRRWLRPGGCIAFSDLVCWTENLSGECREFWASEYPGMLSEASICSLAEGAGYRVIEAFRMPRDAHDAYYRPLEGRLEELSRDVGVGPTEILEMLQREIDVMRRYSDEVGYTFFVLQRVGG